MSYAVEYKKFIISHIEKFNDEYSEHGLISYELFPPIVCINE